MGKFLLAGGTGFIGRALIQTLIREKDDLTVLTRQKEIADRPRLKPFYLFWDPPGTGIWGKAVQGADGVINLAGEPVAARPWTPDQKKKILESRILTTRAIVDAIEKSGKRPEFLINASAIGYYGDRNDEILTETSAPGTGFLAEVCEAWEAEARRAENSGVRVVRIRFGMVLESDGGALGKMLPLFRYGLGGPLGNGRQWVSWIHREDLIGLISFAAKNPEVRGILNAVSPNPVSMKEFSKTLGAVLRRPSFLPVPAPALNFLLGERSELMLSSQRVLSQKARECGFRFEHPNLEETLENCLRTKT